MNKKNRILLGILLSLAFAVSFFMLGAFLAGKMGVAEGQGLASGAIVVGYGLRGGVAGIVLAIILSVYLPARWLITLCVIFGIAGTFLFWKIFGAISESRDQSQAHLEQAYENLPKFQVQMANAGGNTVLPFEQMEMNWGNRNYRVVTGGSSCTVELSGKQAVQMLTALREVDRITFQDPFPCAGTLGQELVKFDMIIPESLPPDTEAKLAITRACLQQHPELEAPLTAAREIHRANGMPKDCN